MTRISAARVPDKTAVAAATARQAQLVKPPGALARLEELAIWLAGVAGTERPAVHARVVVAAADHGVAAEGVSAYPAEVTQQMLGTVATGRAAINAMAAAVGAPVLVIDAGVRDAPPIDGVQRLGLEPSRNIAREPALDERAFEVALAAGRDAAVAAAADGVNVLVGGELGIGNTTPATALTCWLTGRPAAELTGPGTGLDGAGVARKAAVVASALALHGPAITSPLDALRRLGGGDLAVLCGLALGAAEHGIGLVCDGVIATAAIAIAAAHEPGVLPWLVAGHRSAEPAHAALLDHLGLEPVLDLGLRLGEGTGAAAAVAVLRLAAAAHDGMATFAEAGVSEA